MRAVAAVLLLAGLADGTARRVAPDPHHFVIVRGIKVAQSDSAEEGARACVPLDGNVFAHSKPALADVRLFSGMKEIPYALTMSETRATGDSAKVLNRGLRGRHIVFALEMPRRPYTQVNLDLVGRDFLATAKVTGVQSLSESGGTALGSFTLFDLTSQNLTRNTTLPLLESNFPYLRIDLGFIDPAHNVGDIDPAMIQGAEVPPSREAQTIYSTVEETGAIVEKGRESVATFTVPAHVPIERVSFVLGGRPDVNFSRRVRVRAKADGDANAMREDVTGEISRVRMTDHGQKLDFQNLSVPATVGSNAQSAAHMEVAVDNGDDPPLVITSVRLDMRERKLCFDAPDSPTDLYYGDAELVAPVYDYSQLFRPTAPARAAELFGETTNPLYIPPVIPPKPLTERHPELLWIALLAVVSILAVLAVRSARRLPPL